jgi:hypothetical protein
MSLRLVFMTKNFVLWGSAGQAKVLADVVALSGGRVIALFDNRDVQSALAGVPVFVGESGFPSTNPFQVQ